MPELICECGDVLLFGFVSDSAGGMLFPGFLMLLLRVQVTLVGVLKVLPGAFMPRHVIFFSVVLGAGAMGVGSKVAVLRGDLL